MMANQEFHYIAVAGAGSLSGNDLPDVEGQAASAEQDLQSTFDYLTTLMLRENYPGIQSIRFSSIVTKAEKEKLHRTAASQNFQEHGVPQTPTICWPCA